MTKRLIDSDLGHEITARYVGITVPDLKKEIRHRGIKYPYNCANRNRLILALELGRWPNQKELSTDIDIDPNQQSQSIAADVNARPRQSPSSLKSGVHYSVGDEQLPKLLTPRETQAFLRISRATFFRMAQENRLPGAFKLGESWRVDRDKLMHWIEEKSKG